MSCKQLRPATHPRGMVLISSLLLLLVMVLLGVAMFRSFGLQERIAGNVREKQRALHAAESVLEYGELWLSTSTNGIANATSNAITCSSVTAATATTLGICASSLGTVVDTGVTTIPWKISGAEVGFTYNPGNSLNVSTTPATNTYYELPRFYISDLGVAAAGANREIYQVDAWSYGGSTATVAEVESAYEILFKSKSVTGL